MCKQTSQVNKTPVGTKCACKENFWSCSYLWFYTDFRNVNQASKQQENGKGKDDFLGDCEFFAARFEQSKPKRANQLFRDGS